MKVTVDQPSLSAGADEIQRCISGRRWRHPTGGDLREAVNAGLYPLAGIEKAENRRLIVMPVAASRLGQSRTRLEARIY